MIGHLRIPATEGFTDAAVNFALSRKRTEELFQFFFVLAKYVHGNSIVPGRPAISPHEPKIAAFEVGVEHSVCRQTVKIPISDKNDFQFTPKNGLVEAKRFPRIPWEDDMWVH